MIQWDDIRQEFRPMLGLAAPLVFTELGWIGMGFVDTVMVGRLHDSATAVGAVSVGTTLFYTIGLFASGILLGLDTLVSQAYGAGQIEECHRTLWNSLYLALLLSPAVMIAVLGCTPLTLYFALRRYLQAMDIVGPVMFALVSANLVNLLGNWTLVYGHLGFPKLGVPGSGWSTCVSRVYMMLVLAGAAVYYDRKRSSGLWRSSRRLELKRVMELLRVGLPAGSQLLAEIGAFTLATILIARLGAVQLAGHQIAINVASITFMVPMGIGSAAAVRVGQAIGARNFPAASRAGWTALLFGACFMSCSGLLLFSFSRPIARIYTPQADVVKTGATLLIVAAIFQLFDGLQVVATGALRGAGNTGT